MLQTSRLEIPNAAELETMRSDCLYIHSADLSAVGTTTRHHQQNEMTNECEIFIEQMSPRASYVARGCELRDKKRGSPPLSRHFACTRLVAKSKFPYVSGSGCGVGRICLRVRSLSLLLSSLSSFLSPLHNVPETERGRRRATRWRMRGC